MVGGDGVGCGWIRVESGGFKGRGQSPSTRVGVKGGGRGWVGWEGN